MRFFFFILLTVSACAQSVGDFSIPYKANSTGPQTLKSWAKANSTLWGTNGSGNPQSITIGTGLSLTDGVLTASGGGVGTGTVTSVALTMPNIFSVTGSPITASGTLAASLATQSANAVFAGPTTGTAAAPTFRALVAADIPDLSGTYQPLIADGGLTIAKTSGLQAALDAKLSTATAASTYQPLSDNLNTLSAGFGFTLGAQLVTWDGTTYAKLNSAISSGLGGTGFSAYALGDILYAAAGSLSKLSGNTTTAKKFLTQTGDGTASAAPAWGTIQAADVPTLNQNTTGTAAGLSTTLAVASGGTGITSFGTGIATALGVNIGSAGAPVLYNGALGTPSSGVLTNCTVKVEIVIACSDETTALTTGTAKVTFRMPHAMTLSSVRLQVNTAPTGSVIIVDVKEAGTTLFSTKPQIATSAFTSVGGAIPGTLSDTSLADDAEITINLDQIGSTIAGKGLKVTLIGTR